MWRVICIGPGPNDTPRRVVDRGPLITNEEAARRIAARLASTGLYESVRIVRSGTTEGSVVSRAAEAG